MGLFSPIDRRTRPGDDFNAVPGIHQSTDTKRAGYSTTPSILEGVLPKQSRVALRYKFNHSGSCYETPSREREEQTKAI